MKRNLISFLLTFLFAFYSCQKSDESDYNNAVVTDYEGNVYQTVTIGSQVWMSENLKTTHYRNGDPIPNVKNEQEWNLLNTGAYCDYDNDPLNSNKFGRLYNYFVVGDEREIAPEGWRVPTTDDWWELLDYMDANYENVAKAFSAKDGWAPSSEPGAIGNNLSENNESGFSAMAGGRRISEGYTDSLFAPFKQKGMFATWWGDTGVSNDADESIGALSVLLNNYKVNGSLYRIARNDCEGRKHGMSIRCIKN